MASSLFLYLPNAIRKMVLILHFEVKGNIEERLRGGLGLTKSVEHNAVFYETLFMVEWNWFNNINEW